jgi:type IV pilus assembly protein PilE
MKQTQRGFTLIELMITVAIVGILASIAYPSYQSSVMKSRRADAQGALLGFENAMERYFTVKNKYTGAGVGGADTGAPDPIIYTISSETANFYTVTISAATDSTYTLNATPTGAQTNDECGTLTLTHTGVKDVSGADSGVTAADCW